MASKRKPRAPTRNNTASPHFTERLPYIPCKTLLTPGERRFYHEGLAPAAAGRYLIAIKPRLADVVTVEEQHWPKFGARIAQKHVDFALLTPVRTDIVLAVELDDSSHQAAERRYRDDVVADALRAAGVPLIGFPVYRRYDPVKIGSHIDAALKSFRG